MTLHGDRILPLPYLPTYIARRPIHSEVPTHNFTPIYSTNWQKLSNSYATKYRDYDDSPYINIELESIETLPKQYDTYKQSYYPRIDLNSMDSLNRIRPLTVPNHTNRTSEKWSGFLNEYPDRFKINYPLPDDDNDLYYPSQPGRYPYQMNREPPNFYAGLTSRIEPVTNPFRQSESKQKSTVTRPIWIPYGTTHRRYQKPEQK